MSTTSWVCRARANPELKARIARKRRSCSPQRRESEHTLGRNAKFAILTVAIDHQPRWQVELTRANREHYAALHGYTNMFIDSLEGESENLQSLRATVGPKPEDWMSSRLSALYLKVSLLRTHLPRFDYVVWMDLDVYIIDLERPLSTFTGVMEQFGFSVRVCGEEFTRITPRYQFSNFMYIVRNDAAGRFFADAHLANITSMLRRCDDTGLIDQRSQRIALAALVYSEHGKASRSQNPCAHGNPHVGDCTSMHLCLDHALLRLSAQATAATQRKAFT